jgi:hypothetical protein
LKPAASVPAPTPEANAKTGTTIVKSAPPKETARITVKPNLPVAAPVRAGNIPTAKPAVAPGTVPVAAMAAGAAVAAGAAAVAGAPKPVAKGTKPATTIVKTGTTKVPTPSVKPAAVAAGGAVVAAPAVAYEEEASTTLTTALSAALALVTWGTAGVLFASLEGWM